MQKDNLQGGENTTDRGNGKSQSTEKQAGTQTTGSTGAAAAATAVADVKAAGGNIADKALGSVKEKAASVVGEQKTTLAAGLSSLANELRRSGESLKGSGEENQFASMGANYGEAIAGRVEGVSQYLNEKDLAEMATDLEVYARRNPAMFIGSAFLLGFAATRFIKSSSGARAAAASAPQTKGGSTKRGTQPGQA